MRRSSLATAAAVAAAAFAAGAVFGQGGSGEAAGGGPVNVGTPVISGAAQQGQTLTVSNGGWGGNPTSYAYAWSRCDASGGSCAAIAGVTAANSGGSAQATSPPSPVVSSEAAPTNTTAPSVSGSLQVGSTLTASEGSWSGNPTAYAYAWSRCDAHGDSCARIDGATASTYTLKQADAGATLRISVTATNA